ncbi:hypothetical protein BKA93DRAFT_827584 [Sparassis latifolia]
MFTDSLATCGVQDLNSGDHHEAAMYDHLKDLQGDVISRCHGLFKGHVEEEEAVCLVLEYCGAHIAELMKDVVTATRKIHSLRVRHDYFSAMKIVVRDTGKPVIIDFNANTDIVFDELMPLVGDQEWLMCNEMRNVTESVDAWKPRFVRYFCSYVDVKLAATPEDPARHAQ